MTDNPYIDLLGQLLQQHDTPEDRTRRNYNRIFSRTSSSRNEGPPTSTVAASSEGHALLSSTDRRSREKKTQGEPVGGETYAGAGKHAGAHQRK